MAISPLAGKPAPKELLVDVARLEREYYDRKPDVSDPQQLVSFGTSGHRGSSLKGTFNEAHILAATQAICDYRRDKGIDGPLFMGRDTHAVSGPAQRTALEVLSANGVETMVQQDEASLPHRPSPGQYWPTTVEGAKGWLTALLLRRPITRPRTAGSSTILRTEAQQTRT
jgi:phosphoglucomutase